MLVIQPSGLRIAQALFRPFVIELARVLVDRHDESEGKICEANVRKSWIFQPPGDACGIEAQQIGGSTGRGGRVIVTVAAHPQSTHQEGCGSPQRAAEGQG